MILSKNNDDLNEYKVGEINLSKGSNKKKQLQCLKVKLVAGKLLESRVM
jgi:hypothetical protein